MIRLFSSEDEQRIIAAIRAAEHQTSGEVRVHIEKNPQLPSMDDAARVFRALGMHQTQARNAVLIWLAPERKQFVVLGDEGIHAKVGDDFWKAERDLMGALFREGRFADGLVQAIGQIGEKLKEHFPYQSDDTNELLDDISYG